VLPSSANLALPVLMFFSVFAIMLPLNSTLAIPVALVFTVGFALFLFYSSPVVEISSKELGVKGAKIDRKFIGAVTIVPRDEVFDALGPNLDARAWLSIQASVKGLVKIEVTDEQDPCPYWLVSTRNPERVARILVG